jgi:AAA domain
MADNDDLVARGKRIGDSGKYAPSPAIPVGLSPSGNNGSVYPDEEPPPDPNSQLSDWAPPDGRDNEVLIDHLVKQLRNRREAKRRLDDEERPRPPMPAVKSLDTLLAEPDTPIRYRIDQLAPADGRIMLSAQYKSGKTILVDNLVRALADGDDFLGKFTVAQPAQRIVLIDNELSENTLRRWLRDQSITNTAAVSDVVSLRGRLGAFNILDDRRRKQWARRLADLGCDYLVLDCLRPLLDVLGLDENREAGRFLVAFDTLLAEATTTDAALVHHMGHQNERARGDSRLQDWPDAIWKLKREDPNYPTSARYFSAVGRDVNVPEGRLSYDPTTRRLTYVAGSRSDAKGEAGRVAIIRLLAGADGPVKAGDIDALDFPREVVREALQWLIGKGVVVRQTAQRNAKLHRIAYPCSECGLPVVTRQERHLSCDPELVELPDD